MLSGIKLGLVLLACTNIYSSNIEYIPGNEIYGKIIINNESYIVDENTDIVYKTKDGNGLGLLIWEEDGKLPFYIRDRNIIVWRDIP